MIEISQQPFSNARRCLRRATEGGNCSGPTQWSSVRDEIREKNFGAHFMKSRSPILWKVSDSRSFHWWWRVFRGLMWQLLCIKGINCKCFGGSPSKASHTLDVGSPGEKVYHTTESMRSEGAFSISSSTDCLSCFNISGIPSPFHVLHDET